MSDDQQHSRRRFLRDLGRIPLLLHPARTSYSRTGAERTDNAECDQAKKRSRLSLMQLSLRGLFFFTTIVGILLAVYRDELLQRPLLVFGSLGASIFLAFVQGVILWLFDRALWRIFVDGDQERG